VIIALMMEAASTSETSVNSYQTTRNNPEDSHLHTCRRENLKSHSVDGTFEMPCQPVSSLLHVFHFPNYLTEFDGSF
jgi:hypothetical protein